MHVFVYGSLMYDPVWGSVVQGAYQNLSAVAANHRRHAVIGETYPAMVPAAGHSVHGLLWLDVASEDIHRLDVFEGAEYTRSVIEVLGADGQTWQAHTYLWNRPDQLPDADWSVAEFERTGLTKFLDRHVRNWQATGQRKQ